MPILNLRHKLELLFVLSFMDLKLKYQGSVFGFLWSFIKPLLQFIVYYTIFSGVLHIASGKDYALRLFFGVLIWSWFTEATGLGLNAFIGKKSIISKIKTNKFYPPLAAYLTPTMNYMLNFSIFIMAYVLFMPSYPAVIFSFKNIFIFIASLGAISLFIISLNLILASLNVLFRDIQQIWELVLTYGVFLTPIIYQIPISKKYEMLYYCCNLIALPLAALKSVFFINQPNIYNDIHLLLAYITVSLSLFLLAQLCHKRLSPKIVDFL